MSGDHKTHVRAQFAKSVDAYLSSVGHASGPDLEQLLEWGQRRGAARVLDRLLKNKGGKTDGPRPQGSPSSPRRNRGCAG